MPRAALAAAVLCASAVGSRLEPSTPLPVAAQNISYREAARQAANWIVASALPAPSGVGIFWPATLIGQDADASYNRSFDLYSGISGVIVFLLEVHTATGNASYLETASAAGSYLAASTPTIIASNTSTGLYHGGAAGMAFALGVLNDRAPTPAFADAYDALVQYIFDSAVPGPFGGLTLNEYPGLRWGTAGIGLFLLQVGNVPWASGTMTFPQPDTPFNRPSGRPPVDPRRRPMLQRSCPLPLRRAICSSPLPFRRTVASSG